MHSGSMTRALVAVGLTAALTVPVAVAEAAVGGGGGGAPDVGSLYSDLVVAYRAVDGTPILKEYLVDSDEDGVGDTPEYCVQPASFVRVPGVVPTTNPLDGRQVWVIPLQGEWLTNPPDPLPVEEIEACDPQPQYAMFVTEAELERLNLTRTTDEVLTRKIGDVETKLRVADEVSLDPAGRIAADGAALDASPEYAAIYQSLMTTGTIPGLPAAMAGPPLQVPAGTAGSFDAYELAAVAIGTAAGKYVPITVDTVQYYNRIVGFPTADPLPSWPGMYPFVSSEDPDPSTLMPLDVLPGGEDFVDYGDFEYNRAETFPGSVTWLDVPNLTWVVSPILDTVAFTDLDPGAATETLRGPTAFAQMADDVRSVIVFLHENEVVLPGFFMDPVGVDTTQAQLDATTKPAVAFSGLPEQVFQNTGFQVDASLLNPWGGALVDEGRVRITVDAPEAFADAAAVAATAQVGDVRVEVPFTVDGAGDLVGWWGPEAGFPVAPGYHDTTTFDVEVDGTAPAGDYTLTLDLVDVDDAGVVLATDEESTTVNPDELTLLWSGEISPLATLGSYVPLPVRVYAPTGTTDGEVVELSFRLTTWDDSMTELVEELAAGDARLYGDNGVDMVPMALALDASGSLVGTWTAPVDPGFNDVSWYLQVGESAPAGLYGIDAGVTGGTDLADESYVTFLAPDSHGQKPPDVGEDADAPVLSFSVDALTASTVSLTVAANEVVDATKTQCRWASTTDDGTWKACQLGGMTFTGLRPGDYALYVKATDLAGNTATYKKVITVVGRVPIAPALTLLNGAVGHDIAKVNAPASAAGATVRLFKVRADGSLVRPAVAVRRADTQGNARFWVKDVRKLRFTTYKALVGATGETLAAWTSTRRIR